MSQFGQEVDDILIKDGRDWSKAEKNRIELLMKAGSRATLNKVREELRNPPKPQE